MTVSMTVAMTVAMTVSMAVSMAVTVGTSVSVSVSVVGIGLSLSLSGPLAPGHGSEGVSGQTGGVVVAVVAGVDVVVGDSNAVALGKTMSVAVVSSSAPLAVVADDTVETLGRPGNEGGGDTGVGSNSMADAVGKTMSVSKTISRGKTMSVAVVSVSIGIGAPLSEVVSTGSINGALVAVADSGGPGS